MKIRKFLQILIFVIIVVAPLVLLRISRDLDVSDVGRPTDTGVKKEEVEQIEQESGGQEESGEKKGEGLSEANWQWVDNQKKLYESTPAEIDSILKEFGERFSKKADRLKALALLRLGTPYQLGCLGEEVSRDRDPIFRLDVTDCTAFVLTNTALLHSQNLEEAKKMMEFLNYWPEKKLETGEIEYKITFENRLHFTTDRIEVSPYFGDITGKDLCGCALKTAKVTLNRIKEDGKRLIDIDWEKEVVIKYIPNQYITKEFSQRLSKAVGVAFIKEGDEKIGLDVRHEGFLFEGNLFIHASSIQEEVVKEDFFEYYFDKNNNPRFDGILLFDIY